MLFQSGQVIVPPLHSLLPGAGCVFRGHPVQRVQYDSFSPLCLSGSYLDRSLGKGDHKHTRIIKGPGNGALPLPGPECSFEGSVPAYFAVALTPLAS